jgi:ferrous iron transport protein A
MFSQKMTFSGSSLSLLKVGERGTIMRLGSTDDTSSHQLQKMGIIPGISVKLEQRSPAFIISVGNLTLKLDRKLAQSIYVRLAN